MATPFHLVLLLFLLLIHPMSASADLKQIFPQPVLQNPSFEDYCSNGTGDYYFFADGPPSPPLRTISSSNSVAFMKWNATGNGFGVVSGGASEGQCYLVPNKWMSWAPGGVNQTFATAPNASYLVRFDMMISLNACSGPSLSPQRVMFPTTVAIQVSADGRSTTEFSGSDDIQWSQRTYQFQASSYESELAITGGGNESCGIYVDNVRVELVQESASNVLRNGGFEAVTGIGASQDAISATFPVPTGSPALSPWQVTGDAVTCTGSSFFTPAEGQRSVLLGRQVSFVKLPAGLNQTMITQANVTYQVSFNTACQCDQQLLNITMPFCQLEVYVGSQHLNLTIMADNYAAQNPQNPGWIRRVVEFVAASNQTVVGFQDSAQANLYRVQCLPYLDNVVVSIPAQQALLRLKNRLGSPSTLSSWSEHSDPCQSHGGTWVGVTCFGVEVIALVLSGQGLSGAVPFELLALSSLESLNLSNNLMSGSIPSFLGSMPKLVSLDLSHNALQGDIPLELGNLALQELYLQENQLSGAIPTTLALPSLRVLSLQMNNISGSVPQGISLLRDNGTILTFTPGNKNLCSDSTKDLLQRCNPLVTTQSSKSISLLGALGGSAAAIVVLGTIISVVIMKMRQRSKKSRQKIDLKLDNCQAFSLAELEEATRGFSAVLGIGGYGTVYKAKLKDGRLAAVKRRNQVSKQGPEEFTHEVELLSRLHHTNLVNLLGYCIEDKEHILVYEFMPKGSLHQILHSARHQLAWGDRMKIALQVAYGIEYLHYFASPGLVHRDIKSANILLDEENNAKVADFGLCKEVEIGGQETQITTAIKGSFGYMDPAYMRTSRLSYKSDVFSYGVLLLELITGRRAVVEDELLTEWCKQFYQLDVSLMVDPTLARQYADEELRMITYVAKDCVIEDRELRPNMRVVVHRLCQGLPLLVQPSRANDMMLLVEEDEEEEQQENDSSVLSPR